MKMIIMIVMEVSVVKVVKLANQLNNKKWKDHSFKVLNMMINKSKNLNYNKIKKLIKKNYKNY